MTEERSVPKMLVVEAVVPDGLAEIVDRHYRVVKGREPTLEQFLVNVSVDGFHDDYARQQRAINCMLAEGITRWRASFLSTATAEKLRYILGDNADVPIFEHRDGRDRLLLMLNGLVTGSERPRFRLERWKGDINTEAVMMQGTDDMAEKIPHELLREALKSLVMDGGAAAWEIIGAHFRARTAYKP